MSPSTAAAGATVDLSVTVPNESPSVDVVKVQLFFPSGAIASASTPALSGWSATVEEGAAGVESVTWSRGRLAPGKSQSFPATVALPVDRDRLLLKVIETRASGEQVRWIEDPAESGAAGEHPAPVLQITGAVTTTVAPSTTTSSSLPASTEVPSASSNAKEAEGGNGVGRILVLGGVGILIAVIVRAWLINRKNS